MTQSTRLLRLALQIDGGATAALGLLMAVAAGGLAGPLGLPQSLLLVVGALYLPWGLFLLWLGGQAMPSRRLAWFVVVVNLVAVADSVLLLGFVSPTALGTAFVLGQAAAGLALTLVQITALRRPQVLA